MTTVFKFILTDLFALAALQCVPPVFSSAARRNRESDQINGQTPHNIDSMMAARMVNNDPREREYLRRQREAQEIKELMDRYAVKEKKNANNGLNGIVEDKPE